MMKKMAILILFITLSFRAYGPEHRVFYLFEEPPIYPYNLTDPLARSVAHYESDFNYWAVNPVSGARGLMQIMMPAIKEANKILIADYGSKVTLYTWNDAFDPFKSIEIWYIIQNHHNPSYDLNKACKLWFGSGRQYDGKTWKDYVKQIKKHL